MLLLRIATSIRKGLCNLDFKIEVFSQPLFIGSDFPDKKTSGPPSNKVDVRHYLKPGFFEDKDKKMPFSYLFFELIKDIDKSG